MSRSKIRSLDKSLLKVRTEKNALAGTLKVGSVAILFLLQLGVQIFLYGYFAALSGIYSLIAFILSVISCIFLLTSNNRSPASKAVWAVIILVFFEVGFILYFLTDSKVFFRRQRKRFKEVFAHGDTQRCEREIPEIADSRIREDCEYLKTVGGFDAFAASPTKYFSSGGQLFDDILEKISQAEKFIFIEFFIISDGKLLEKFISILSEKVKSGVEVRIIYDDLGSRDFSRKQRRAIKNAGIKLMTFNKLIPAVNFVLNIRDHRKIVVVDGKYAYTGGANIADEYVNDSRMYGYWKDEGIRVEGEAVDGFSLMFLRQWDFLCRSLSDYTPYFNHFEKCSSGSVAVPFSCGLDLDVFIGKELYLNIMAKASKKLYLFTPYLVPDDFLFNMLVNKAQSGCDVRIVLPSIPDKPYVYIVSLDFAARLADKGVKILLMRDSFVHSKIIFCDYCAVVGSINVDLRSFYQQFESALYVTDTQTLKDIERDFEKTFTECDPLVKKQNNLKNKLITSVLKIVSPLM